MIIELDHPTDPRYLLVYELPERVTIDDLASWRYGKALTTHAGGPVTVYPQPGGPGTPWVRPS